MAIRTVLLVGRMPFVLDDVHDTLDPSLDVDMLTGTTVDDVVSAFTGHAIDAVILGAGIDLEARLEIIRRAFTLSENTSVHMKDRSSGRGGMMPFANGVLTGLVAKAG